MKIKHIQKFQQHIHEWEKNGDRERKRDGIEKELNVLTFSQSSSSDVLNFHNFSKNGIFQYAAFIMETSWWNYALVIVQRSLYIRSL